MNIMDNNDNLVFEYFRENESEQFSFIKVPKLFFTDGRFGGLSYGAKILYGLLLDRMSLSRKNKWRDAEKRVYVIYTIERIKADFNVSGAVAIKLMKELEQFGLIEKKRRPNEAAMIYVKNFVLPEEVENREWNQEILYDESPSNRISKYESPEYQDMEFQNMTLQEVVKKKGIAKNGISRTGNPKYENPELQEMEFQKTEDEKIMKEQGIADTEIPRSESPEFQNIESNKTNINTLKDDDSSSSSSKIIECSKIAIRRRIYEKIGYSGIHDRQKEVEVIALCEEIISCLVELFASSPKKKYKINDAWVTVNEVQKRVLDKLTGDNFEAVLENITANGSGTIFNLSSYIIICFWNIEKVKRIKKKSKNSFNDYQQREYDFEKIERELLCD